MAASNEELAGVLDEIADALETTGANRYRTLAYTRAAEAVRDADRGVSSLHRERGEDGIKEIPGIGEGISSVLSEYLEQGRSRLLDDLRAELEPEALFARFPGEAPSDELLLEIDREYRSRAEAGDLRTIAPRRFNPDDEAWLPILETSRDGWEFTALFSNTARAHEAGKTRDWVVIYWERDGAEGQDTVVTAERGPHAGERLVAR